MPKPILFYISKKLGHFFQSKTQLGISFGFDLISSFGISSSFRAGIYSRLKLIAFLISFLTSRTTTFTMVITLITKVSNSSPIPQFYKICNINSNFIHWLGDFKQYGLKHWKDKCYVSSTSN